MYTTCIWDAMTPRQISQCNSECFAVASQPAAVPSTYNLVFDMRHFAGSLIAVAWLAAAPVFAQPTNFEHIVIIVQENRTPDNLFYAMCATEKCSTKPDKTEYDIQTANWLDKDAQGGTIEPTAIPLANAYDLDHTHNSFVAMCDLKQGTETCQMDGAAGIGCKKEKNCPPDPQFK